VHAASNAQQPGSITVTFLELDDPEKVTPPGAPMPGGLGTRVIHDPARNRDLYSRVGNDYSWFDRLVWTDKQWSAWSARVETHVLELHGQPIGYFELEPERSATKIAIFGLLAPFHGRGLGGHALTLALRRAFELRPRVWLTTCSLDSPAALPNYRARGLEVFRTERRQWYPPSAARRTGSRS